MSHASVPQVARQIAEKEAAEAAAAEGGSAVARSPSRHQKRTIPRGIAEVQGSSAQGLQGEVMDPVAMSCMSGPCQAMVGTCCFFGAEAAKLYCIYDLGTPLVCAGQMISIFLTCQSLCASKFVFTVLSAALVSAVIWRLPDTSQSFKPYSCSSSLMLAAVYSKPQ